MVHIIGVPTKVRIVQNDKHPGGTVSTMQGNPIEGIARCTVQFNPGQRPVALMEMLPASIAIEKADGIMACTVAGQRYQLVSEEEMRKLTKELAEAEKNKG